MKLTRMLEQLSEAWAELEELLECGDLEDQLEAALRVQTLEAECEKVQTVPRTPAS